MQVEVKGVGRFVVLVSKVINDQQHHGNKGIFVVAERIETRTVWLLSPTCIERILPPAATANDPDASTQATQIIHAQFSKLGAVFPKDWPIVVSEKEAQEQKNRESQTLGKRKWELVFDKGEPKSFKIAKSSLSSSVKVRGSFC